MDRAPRIALFADTFHEVNGAARTLREWTGYAGRKRLPLFVVRSGNAPAGGIEPESGMEVSRGRLAFTVDDGGLRFDPFFWRKLDRLEMALRDFQPDAIHLTSPGDHSIAGAILAAKLRVPLAFSWHTNVHEFAARRVARSLAWLPSRARSSVCARVERFVMDRVTWFFGRGELIFAPNPDLVDLLQNRTGKRVLLMKRGIDTRRFHPWKREHFSGEITIGYAGRLTPEKNVRFLARLSDRLAQEGCRNFRFLIVGDGSERAWLEKAIPGAAFTGLLAGEALARAYASMDVFAFPSRTDAFGNVVQEAMACGVPVVATADGGPKYIVKHGVTGWVAPDDEAFCRYVRELVDDGAMRQRMGAASREQMIHCSWDAIFDGVYRGYAELLGIEEESPAKVAV